VDHGACGPTALRFIQPRTGPRIFRRRGAEGSSRSNDSGSPTPLRRTVVDLSTVRSPSFGIAGFSGGWCWDPTLPVEFPLSPVSVDYALPDASRRGRVTARNLGERRGLPTPPGATHGWLPFLSRVACFLAPEPFRQHGKRTEQGPRSGPGASSFRATRWAELQVRGKADGFLYCVGR